MSRPVRRAAAKASAAVSRPLSPSPMLSDDEEMLSSSSELGDNLSDEEELDEPDIRRVDNLNDDDEDDDDLESLSEQEDNDLEDDEEDDVEMQDDDMDNDDEDDDDEDDEDEQMPVTRKPPTAAASSASRSSGGNKRKKPAIPESDEDEEAIFSDDDTEILRNKPMTKRQRAKVNQEIPEEYLELPMDTGKKKHLTEEEEQLKKSEVARRRKNQSIQRAEKDKADTINRLLKKQASKSKRIIDDADDKETPHEKLMRLEDPNRIRYTSTAEGSKLSIPSIFTMDQLFGGSVATSPNIQLKKCQVDGCPKNRKYTAKKSGKFVCSLEHYKVVETN